jgi:hypothetical protein
VHGIFALDALQKPVEHSLRVFIHHQRYQSLPNKKSSSHPSTLCELVLDFCCEKMKSAIGTGFLVKAAAHREIDIPIP